MSQPVFTGPDGVEVQAIGLDSHISEYRVKRMGYWLPYWDGWKYRNPYSMAELSKIVDLGTLEAPC
jgi:hypothetical protein